MAESIQNTTSRETLGSKSETGLSTRTNTELLKLTVPDKAIEVDTTTGESIKIIRGCTDPKSLNYNPNATVDDGSCAYLPPTDNIVVVSVNSTPKGTTIQIDGIDTNKITPSQLRYTDKELLTPRVITVIRPGHITLTKYRISTKSVFTDLKTTTKVVDNPSVEVTTLESKPSVISEKTKAPIISEKTLEGEPITTPITRTSTTKSSGTTSILAALKETVRQTTSTDTTFGTKSDVKVVTTIDEPVMNYFEIVLEKYINGRWVQQPVKTLSDLTDSNSSIRNLSLSFDSFDFKAIPGDESTIEVQIIGDVFSDGVVKYNTSNDIEDFVINDTNVSLKFKRNSLRDIPWIQFSSTALEDSAQFTKYTVTTKGKITPTVLEDDFRLELKDGVTIINVESSKLVVTPPDNTPIVLVDNDQLQYNISDTNPLKIPYYSQFTDIISYQLGSTKREIAKSGSLVLTKADFSNAIGKYILLLQPKSDTGKVGDYKRITINVINKDIQPGPDITHVTYPANIIGASFTGYNHPFKISWQSVNTNYINVYVSSYDAEHILCKSTPQGTLTLNVKDVLTRAKVVLDPDVDIITFKLILVPINVEGSDKTIGNPEEITIEFDKGNLTLVRSEVIRDIRNAFVPELDTTVFDIQTSKYLTHYTHFGDGDNKLIATWATDSDTFSEFIPDSTTGGLVKTKEVQSLVFKLYEPLDRSIQTNQLLWVSKLQSVPIIEQITLIDEVIDTSISLTPNFNYELGDDIGYQVMDSLVASGSISSTELVNEYIGRNELSLTKLNIDYTSGSNYMWTNFVKYSSATERTENFYYKIKLLEFYEDKLTTLKATQSAISSIAVINESNRISGSIKAVKSGFDDFEYTMYSVSSSLSYPGAGQTSISASTHDDTTTWYNTIKASAVSYDDTNVNALVYNLPDHIINDTNGQEFILFFNMIGQHFDIIWSYTSGITDSKKLVHKFDAGVTNDLLYHMLGSLGWEVDSSTNSQFLWEYAFGKHEDGTSSSITSGKQRQTEVWRRLINNLPYLYKHKGTKRSLSAAMACYGIPNSMLSIMEFGGTVDPTDSTTNTFTFDDRASAIKCDNTASILIPWKTYNITSDFPNCVEVRVNTDARQDHTLIQAEGWDLKVKAGTGSLASIVFNITGSSNPISASTGYFPFFNDEYTQIAVNKYTSGSVDIFDVYAKEGFNERIRNEGYAQVTASTGNTTWAYGTELEMGAGLTGSIDDFRLWTTALSESRVENHTLMPDAIDGNHVSASTTDLIFRLDFEYPKDRAAGGDTAIKNVSSNLDYTASYATASNFTTVTTYPYQYIPYERTVTATIPSTGIGYSSKIRFKDQSTDNYLNSKKTVTVTEDETTYGSSKLGLFFSPMKEINLDIVRSLGKFNIDDYIGNPADEFNDTYSALDELRDYYFDRYNLNIYEYIQLVRYIDTTLFLTLESLVPGRAKVASGLLIEPHILERSKIKRGALTAEKLSHSSSIDLDDNLSMTSSYDTTSASLDATTTYDFTGSVPQYTASFDASLSTILTSSLDMYTSSYDVEPDLSGSLTRNSGSDMGGISMTTAVIISGSLQGSFTAMQQSQVGMDPDSITNTGFDIFAENGHTIRTYRDLSGNLKQERKKVYVIKESYTEIIPENINALDSSLGTQNVSNTKYRYTVSMLPFTQSAPDVTGSIVEVTPLDGYLPSHYRNVGETSTGLKNSYYRGSTQTSSTTIDGESPVQTFVTNPNVLKVSDTGRASGEPILETD